MNAEFLQQMELELAANQYKDRGREWHPDLAEVRQELRRHSEKLHIALTNRNVREIREFTADIANLMMKTFEDFGQ